MLACFQVHHPGVMLYACVWHAKHWLGSASGRPTASLYSLGVTPHGELHCDERVHGAVEGGGGGRASAVASPMFAWQFSPMQSWRTQQRSCSKLCER